MAAWLEINVGIPTNDVSRVASIMIMLAISIIHVETGGVTSGWSRARLKHVLSTLFIEHSPSASYWHAVVFPNIFFWAWRDGVTLMDQRYA